MRAFLAVLTLLAGGLCMAMLAVGKPVKAKATPAPQRQPLKDQSRVPAGDLTPRRVVTESYRAPEPKAEPLVKPAAVKKSKPKRKRKVRRSR